MEEILSKLLESDLLSEETKTEISEAWSEAVEAKKADLREEVTMEVRAELAEQFVVARDALIEKVQDFVAEQIESEFTDLKSDIERFRDLEVEFAGKLVEEKHKLAEEVEAEMETLVEKINSFLEVRIADELAEFKDDIEIVKENNFGRKMFEAFATEFSNNFNDDTSVQGKLAITESKLADVQARLQEIESEKSKMLREQKMQEVLAPLAGSKREQMSFILQNVETEKLNEAYGYFIGRIIKENTTNATLTEETTVVTGEAKPIQRTKTENAQLEQMKRLAGVA